MVARRQLLNDLSISGYEIMYRTGDFGRIVGGRLYYEGRADSQIKVRGHRVDLTEINAVVQGLEEVKKGVVLCYKPGQPEQVAGAVIPTELRFNEGIIFEGNCSVCRESKQLLSFHSSNFEAKARVLRHAEGITSLSISLSPSSTYIRLNFATRWSLSKESLCWLMAKLTDNSCCATTRKTTKVGLVSRTEKLAFTVYLRYR